MPLEIDLGPANVTLGLALISLDWIIIYEPTRVVVHITSRYKTGYRLLRFSPSIEYHVK